MSSITSLNVRVNSDNLKYEYLCVSFTLMVILRRVWGCYTVPVGDGTGTLYND
jgi:hypothetical protein